MNDYPKFLTLTFLTVSLFLTNTYVFGAIYHCEDSSGITVLTDSPVQLDKCTLLSEDSTIVTTGTIPQRTSTSHPPVSLPNQDISEVKGKDENTEYSFIEEGEEALEDEHSKTVIVPVKSYGGSLLVKVQLNHTRTANLILDTGATMTVLSNDVALDLGLNASTATQLSTVNTAGGPIQVNLTKIASIQAGTAQVNDVDVAIHDLPDGQAGIDGLLGMSFLNHFLVTLDTIQGQLHLQPRS